MELKQLDVEDLPKLKFMYLLLEIFVAILLHIGGILLIGFGLYCFLAGIYAGVYGGLKTISSFFGDWFAYGFRVAVKASGDFWALIGLFMFYTFFGLPLVYAGLYWLDIFWDFGLPQPF